MSQPQLESQEKKPPRVRRAHTEYVYRVDWNRFQPNRAGVIVYTIHDGRILFGLGLDRRYRELTDFGGGVRYTKDKSAVVGALREFMEESLYTFGAISPSDVCNSLVTYSPQTAILIVYIPCDPIESSIVFRERASVIDSPEVSEIVWLTHEEFAYTIRNGKTYGGVRMYKRVREVLRNSAILKA